MIIDLVFGTGAWRFLNLQTGVWRLVIRIFVILAHNVLQCARIMKKALRFVSACCNDYARIIFVKIQK